MSTTALAAHCPRGQIWRVHANICIGKQAQRASLPRARARGNPEVPSHHGITYVHVIEPPVTSSRAPAQNDPPPEIHIPYELPPSRWNHVDVVDFERIGK